MTSSKFSTRPSLRPRRFLSILLLLGLFSSQLSFYTPEAHAVIANGGSATNVLGQLDGNGVPRYTTGIANNNLGSVGLTNPYDVAIDSVGHRMFVADAGAHRVLVFNLTTGNALTDYQADYVLGQPDFATVTSATTQSGLNAPEQLIFVSTTNQLFVSDTGNHRVMVFDVASITNGENATNVLGQANFTANSTALTQTGFNIPRGLAYSATNTLLYVADFLNNRVMVFNVASISNGEAAVNVLGQANFTGSSSGRTQSAFTAPQRLAYDTTNDRLFVGDYSNNRIMVFNLAGGITDGMNASNVLGQLNFTDFANETSQTTTLYINGLAYDTTNSRLFVADSSNRVLVFDVTSISNGEAAANVLGQANFTGSAAGTTSTTLSGPQGLAYDAGSGLLHVSDATNNRVLIFDVASISNGEAATNVAGQIDVNGTIVFTAGTANNGGITAQNTTGFNSPYDVAIDITNHRLFAADYLNNRVLVFNLNNSNQIVDYVADAVLGQSNFRATGTGTTSATLNSPAYSAYDSANSRLFVTDAGNHRVMVFDVASISNGEAAVNVLGQANFTTADPGTTSGTLNTPQGLSFDSANSRLFVTDAGNNRVMVFDVASISNGEAAVNVLGQANFTTATGDTTQAILNFPVSVAYDGSNNRLFVGEVTNNRVMVFDVASISNGEAAVNVLGQVNFTTATAGTTDAKLNTASGVSFDATNNRLFVSDYTNNRVMVFDVASITNGEAAVNVLGQANFTTATATTTQSSTTTPGGLIYIASTGELFVAEFNTHRITVFDAGLTPPNTAPAVTVNSAAQATDGTGVVSISATVSDADSNNTKLKVMYAARTGDTCGDETFTAKATLSETASDTTATVTPKPVIENDDAYQVGTTTPILTTSANTVTFKWNSQTDLASANGPYCLRFTPNDATVDGTAVYQSVTLDNVAPSAPTSFTATPTGADVALTWANPVSDFASVTIRRSASAFPASATDGTSVLSGSSSTSYSNTGLSDSAYYYSIFARDTAGNYSSSATAQVTVDSTAPSVPGNLTVSARTTTSLTLAFGAASSDTNFSNYKIFYKAGSSGVTTSDSVWNSTNDSNLGSVSYGGATTTTITGLTINTQYVFNIWAYDTYGNIRPAATELVAYTVVNTPSAPTVDGATTTTLNVTVNANSNPANTTYAICQTSNGTSCATGGNVQTNGSLGSTATWQTVAQWGSASGTSGKITVTGLSINNPYQFLVKARNGDSVETSLSSASTTAYTLAGTPSAPTVDGATTTALNVTINANSNPAGTQFAIKETVKNKYVQTSGILGDSAVWQTVAQWGSASGIGGKIVASVLDSNTQYTFAVKARNGSSVETDLSTGASLFTVASGSSRPQQTEPSQESGGGGGGGGGGGAAPATPTQESLNSTANTLSSQITATVSTQTTIDRPLTVAANLLTIDPATRERTAQLTSDGGSLTIRPNAGATVSVDIPADTTVRGNSEWNGSITPPLIRPRSIVATVGEPIVGSTETLTQDEVNTIINVGSSTSPLTFSRPVQLHVPTTGLQSGTIVELYSSSDGNTWTRMEGTFTVTNNSVTFSTTHFTYFAVASTGKVDTGETQVAPVSTEVKTSAEVSTSTEDGMMAEKPAPFTDIVKHWSKEFVGKLYVLGVVSGKSATRFEPDAPVTRAEITKIALNAFGHTVSGETDADAFSDVRTSAWYAPYIQTAKREKIVGGYSDGTFRPNQSVTRAEALKILFGAAKLSVDARGVSLFKDTPQVSWYMKFVAFAKANDIVAGYPDGTFRPGASITRAEVAKIAVKVMGMGK